MTEPTRDLAVAVDAAAAAVPGVERLYAAVPTGIQAARQILATDPAPLSDVARRDGRLVVTVSVGVGRDQDTAGIAARTADVVRVALGEGVEAEAARVHVRVSRVALD